jgi:NADH dehydrogenase
VLEHVIGFHDVLLLRPLGLKPDRPHDDPQRRWELTYRQLEQAFEHDIGPDVTAMLPNVTRDVLVHTWDLARAVGADDRLDARWCESFYAALPGDSGTLSGSGMFGAPVAVGEQSDVQSKLLARLGRNPGWRPPADQEIVVLGSGFAGLWAALSAARRLDELDIDPAAVGVTMISSRPFHDIRVRNYEADLTPSRIPLPDILGPVGVSHIAADVTAIDPAARTVTYSTGSRTYDRLVIALGSGLVKPDIAGLAEFGFDVDTFDGAMKLSRHLAALADGPADPASETVVVVGAGLTGIETACELPGRLARAAARVVLVDRHPSVGSDMGEFARPVIEQALADNGIEIRTGAGISDISADGITLTSGETIATRTVIWCAGMRANPLTAQFGIHCDDLGRLPVDEYLRVVGVPGVFAAGDVAALHVDDDHMSVMSCQHGRPMGRYAGHNVVGDLLGEPMLALQIPWYVTVLDLGPAGAVYTEGWDRHVVAQGQEAKATKRTINTERIYPPLNGNRDDILSAAAPVLQDRPSRAAG